MQKNIHGFIHNSLKLETAQMFFSSRINQSAVLYSHKTILYSTKEEWTTNKQQHGWILRHHAEWKEPDTVECLLHDPIYIKFKNKKNWSIPIGVRKVVILSGS